MKPDPKPQMKWKLQEIDLDGSTLTDVIARLEELRNEHGDKASLNIEIDDCPYDGETRAQCYVQYQALETEEEVAKRIKSTIRGQEHRDMIDKRQYEALKKKFENE